MALNPIIRDNANTTRFMRYCKQHENDDCKILSKEEEQSLIARLKDIDPDKLREKLIMHNVAIVFKLATKWMGTTRSYDDLVQRGLQGLTLAAQKFDLNQSKTKFATYAYFWVHKYIFDHGWKETYDKKDVLNTAISLDSAIASYSSKNHGDNDGADVSNYLEDHLDPNQSNTVISTEHQLQQNAMENIYSNLQEYMLSNDFTDTDRKVFDGAFVYNLNNKRISVDYDIPLPDVKRSYAKILKFMKDHLAKRNIHCMEEVY